MSFVSVAQYREVIQSLLDYIPQPRENRHVSDSPSGELFTAGGDKITGLKLKFYIEDDGGTWASEGLIKPSFIWDMKKIAGGVIIDSGSYTTHLNLVPKNLRETDDGLYFLDSSQSYLSSQLFNNNFMENKNVLLNIWFTPSLKSQSENSVLFNLNSVSRDTNGIRGYDSILRVDIIQESNNQQSLHISKLHTDGRIISFSSNIPIFTNNLNNLQLFATDGLITYLINGKIGTFAIPGGIGPEYLNNDYSNFEIGKGFKGEISYINYLVTTESISNSVLLLQHKLRYPLPRSKQLVDLSDYFETKGKNLLINVGTISKSIENLRGQLYVKTNSIKVGN